MPYISKEDRASFAFLDAIKDLERMTPGDLNYCITRICDQYITRKGFGYTHINDVVGALECAKLELYRRLAAPYEDIKVEQNGDVYENKLPAVKYIPRCPLVLTSLPPMYCDLPEGHEGPHDHKRRG